MINTFNQKLSHFRSQLHLGRYENAVVQGQALLQAIYSIKVSKLLFESIDVVEKHIEAELKIAKQIRQLYNKKTEQRQKNEKQVKVEQKSWHEEQPMKKQENIGKWSKKKYSKWSPSKSNRISNNSSVNFVTSVKLANQLQSQVESSLNKYKILQQDEQQILERQTILPLNLPAFFKKKEPHRLIICHYDKCNQIIKILRSGLNFKFDVVQLEEIGEWSPCKRNEVWKVIVAPFFENPEKIIIQVLGQSLNILILYTDIQRQIQTEKLSSLEKGTSLSW